MSHEFDILSHERDTCGDQLRLIRPFFPAFESYTHELCDLARRLPRSFMSYDLHRSVAELRIMGFYLVQGPVHLKLWLDSSGSDRSLTLYPVPNEARAQVRSTPGRQR